MGHVVYHTVVQNRPHSGGYVYTRRIKTSRGEEIFGIMQHYQKKKPTLPAKLKIIFFWLLCGGRWYYYTYQSVHP
jgi:hypothetical protein